MATETARINAIKIIDIIDDYSIIQKDNQEEILSRLENIIDEILAQSDKNMVLESLRSRLEDIKKAIITNLTETLDETIK